VPAPRFDFDEVFGDDYLHFAADYLTEARSDDETAEILSLVDLAPGATVLDAPCGHGRIANRLAAAGMVVTGIDRQAHFLRRAAADAASMGVDALYLDGDLRALPVTGPFDLVVCWFNSFGYFEDHDNALVLSEFHRVLRPGGTVLIEALHHDGVVRHFSADPDAVLTEVGDDAMVDLSEFDADTGRLETERVIHRAGQVRRSHHSIRLPTIPEWRRWLTDAGFADVSVTSRTGAVTTLEDWDVVVRARA
jgi:SAM-dependent methyltransferase